MRIAAERLCFVLLPAVLLGPAPRALAGGERAKSAKPWQQVKTPAPGPARAIGATGAGCLQGAEPLSLDGPGFHVTRPGRTRFFGHPALVDFVRELGRRVQEGGHGVILVGDLGQARGGPTASGHASHQNGLDVDIWYWHAKSAEKPELTKKERKRLGARAVVSADTQKKTRHWSSKVGHVLELAATDRRVARIFVNPGVKRALCEEVDEDARGWLHKLRPWWGHNAHFHVRLECPADSPDCESQAAIPPGDGCDKLDWWLAAKAKKERSDGRKRYRKKVRGAPELPKKCQALLE